VFGGFNGVSFASAAFDPATTPGFVQSQFSNLLPGLLAVGSWRGGDAILLQVNPLLAGAALLGGGRPWLLMIAAAAVAIGVVGPADHCGTSAARQEPESQTHDIEFLQKANRLPLDGTRRYAEQTVSCLSGYWVR
jgi:hypothetical protein